MVNEISVSSPKGKWVRFGEIVEEKKRGVYLRDAMRLDDS